MGSSKRSVPFDLHLVYRRLEEIIQSNEYRLSSSEQILDEVVALQNLVRAMLHGYAADDPEILQDWRTAEA